MTPNTRTATLLAVMIAAAMISGCLHAEEKSPAPAIGIPTPRDIPEPIEAPEAIDLIMADISQNNIANKSEYSIHTQYGSDIYVCSHIACRQSEYLVEKGYNAGVVILWAKHLGTDHHAQSWVEIDNETYVIESISNIYWQKWAHKTVFDWDYKIRFVSLEKGWEHAKVSSETLHS